jgi:hypothetical protein
MIISTDQRQQVLSASIRLASEARRLTEEASLPFWQAHPVNQEGIRSDADALRLAGQLLDALLRGESVAFEGAEKRAVQRPEQAVEHGMVGTWLPDTPCPQCSAQAINWFSSRCLMICAHCGWRHLVSPKDASTIFFVLNGVDTLPMADFVAMLAAR